MTTRTWHLDEPIAERYVAGQAGHVLAASIEQHLIGCPTCRSRLTPYVDHARGDEIWAGVLEQVQAPQPSALERLLRALGLAESTARLLAVTPTLRASWLTGVLFVLIMAQLAAQADPGGIALFMALAPVLPMISVAAAFGGEMDPSREMVGAAPYPILRLLFVRTAAVVAATMVPAAVLAVLLPASTWTSLGWLIPSLALTSVLMSAPQDLVLPGAGILSTAWMGLVGVGWLRLDDPFFAAAPVVQLTSLAILGTALLLLLVRHDFIAEEIRRPS